MKPKMKCKKFVCKTTEECDQLAKELVLGMLQSGVIRFPAVIVKDPETEYPDSTALVHNAQYLHHLIARISLTIESDPGVEYTKTKESE